jgi:hypothetical protein
MKCQDILETSLASLQCPFQQPCPQNTFPVTYRPHDVFQQCLKKNALDTSCFASRNPPQLLLLQQKNNCGYNTPKYRNQDTKNTYRNKASPTSLFHRSIMFLLLKNQGSKPAKDLMYTIFSKQKLKIYFKIK